MGSNGLSKPEFYMYSIYIFNHAANLSWKITF